MSRSSIGEISHIWLSVRNSSHLWTSVRQRASTKLIGLHHHSFLCQFLSFQPVNILERSYLVIYHCHHVCQTFLNGNSDQCIVGRAHHKHKYLSLLFMIVYPCFLFPLVEQVHGVLLIIYLQSIQRTCSGFC